MVVLGIHILTCQAGALQPGVNLPFSSWLGHGNSVGFGIIHGTSNPLSSYHYVTLGSWFLPAVSLLLFVTWFHSFLRTRDNVLVGRERDNLVGDQGGMVTLFYSNYKPGTCQLTKNCILLFYTYTGMRVERIPGPGPRKPGTTPLESVYQ